LFFTEIDTDNASPSCAIVGFGIEIGGEAGIPYITKGTATSNLKVTVECSFPKED